MAPFCRMTLLPRDALFAHHRVGMSEEVVADPRSAIDDHVRQQDGVVADVDVIVNHHIGADVRVRANAWQWEQ